MKVAFIALFCVRLVLLLRQFDNCNSGALDLMDTGLFQNLIIGDVGDETGYSVFVMEATFSELIAL